MKKGVLIIVIAVLAIAGAVVFGKDSVDKVRLGVGHPDDGQQHIQPGTALDYGKEEPPTSGDHSSPVDKGAYTSEIPDENSIHNLEHGYVYISYRPDLPQNQIDKLTALFFDPYSNSSFAPTKVIMAPRAANESPIVFSSWTRSLKFDNFDEQQMIDYYLGNVSKSPEPAGR